MIDAINQGKPAVPASDWRRCAGNIDWLSVIEKCDPALFHGMSRAQMAMLLNETTVQHLRRPTELLRQGEAARWGYLILAGRIEVSFIDINGNRILAHLARAGEVLGEVEQFSGLPCAATCTTLPDTTVMLFDAALVLRHMSADMILRNFAGIFHNRLCRDNRQQTVAMFYAAEDRLRIHLLGMTSDNSPSVQISQTELAAFAGCSRQTANRTLAQLRAEGIVAIGRGSIRVLDRTRLAITRSGGEQMVLESVTVPTRNQEQPRQP
ncbi:Crp/Fnr family transcriptional regulator [Paracoccus sp. JM45]|uniref:Crp/Fnr family transcriptional regulator n=1 Tax=Paracoccus sp. JM45 TaxID=2283626 RepID=UPI000E6CD38B|nr:Crp/Fnr family transcriptional regulator [Paracoccus sp. JM45]RJE79744.1 Crp/Fnr family transcriptional regulator [Paracoccus sp. JM45]